MRLDVQTHQLDTIWCNWTCLDMRLDISVTIVQAGRFPCLTSTFLLSSQPAVLRATLDT